MPLSHGVGKMPVLGFGTLIPDAAETIVATRARWKLNFNTSIVRNDIGTSAKGVRPCRQDSPLEGLRVKNSS